MGLLNIIKRLLTWWDGQTIGTQLFTWRKGVKVGEDSQGNIFYKTRDDSRRWVIFNGEIEDEVLGQRRAVQCNEWAFRAG